MTNFSVIFSGVLLLNVGLTVVSSDWWKKRQARRSGGRASSSSLDEETEASKEKWKKLLRRYLIVYLTATLSDWLQGPYVYALYDAYGYPQHDIAVLFVAGFGSSMIFGSFVGGMADWGGRRAFVILFSIVYAFSCLTKRTYSLTDEDTSHSLKCELCIHLRYNFLLLLRRFQRILHSDAGSLARWNRHQFVVQCF
jgi:Na+/melibiose symporter-like transporter